MMGSKPRSFDGCWTCRLRRKKCDEGRPICNGCAALDIDCLYSEDKPEWMDGGEKQKEKGDWLKREVKRRANLRREQRYMQGLEVKLESLGVAGNEDGQGIIATARQGEKISERAPPISTGTSMIATTHSSPSESQGDSSASVSASVTHTTTAASSISEPSSPPANQDNVTRITPDLGPGIPLEEREAYSTMLYLDYVFPFLFPFYRPSLLDTGRGWLLVLLTRNKALFHIALSMSGYFNGVMLANAQEEYESQEVCKSHNLESLQQQQDLALQALQLELREVVNKGVRGHLAEASRVMASIVQLLTSEVAVANHGNWTMHLEAASELFDEIMKHHATTEDGHSCFMMLLLQLGSIPFSWTPKHHPWGSDQATLRFFTAQLVLLDVVASVTLEQRPRLQHWHLHLLSKLDDETMKHFPQSAANKETAIPHIDLAEFCGIQNWVIAAIGEVAALDEWKKEMKKHGSLSILELVGRAAMIEGQMCARLEELRDSDSRTPPPPACPSSALLQYSASGGMSASSHGIHSAAANTRIWAQAALTFLKVVVSGWQPASLEIRASVSATVDLLLQLPAPDCLRTVVWPFAVAGCLATREQEQVFRSMFTALGPLQAFGTVRECMAILEHVWASRAQIDECPDQWDLAACFRCLGRPALLI